MVTAVCRLILLTLALCVGLGALALPASAEHAVLGIPNAGPAIDTVICKTQPCTFAQTESPDGNFAAPADGRITEWWAGLALAPVLGQLRILERVLPATQVRYQVVASSVEATIDKNATHHPTDLPVKANDVIAIETPEIDHRIGEPQSTTSYELLTGSYPDGTTKISSGETHGSTLEYAASFAYRPVVSHLDVASGSIDGGATVMISGNHLTESTAVRFGVKDADFLIVSNTQIAAKVPAEAAGTVDVTVVGPGGTSATAGTDQYTYAARTATVAPDVLDFGDQPVGKPTGVRAVTLTNTGKVPMSVASVGLTGDGAGDFTTISDGCGGKQVAVGAACSVQLVFTPSAVGTRRVTLRLVDNAVDGPHTVIVTGTGATTAISAPTPPPTTSAPTPPKTTSTPARFTVTSLRGTTLTLTLNSRGTVRVIDAGPTHPLLRASSETGGPGRIVVPLQLTAPAHKTLARHGRLTVHARIAFAPRSGKPITKVRTLIVRRRQ
jgi:hypothetical protein